MIEDPVLFLAVSAQCSAVLPCTEAPMVRMCMISLLLRSKIAILKKCHIWHHSKKVPYTGCPTNIVMETPCKKITRNNEKRRYEKKTETEKNRADTILVF